METKDELKPCPFCGGEAEILQRGAMSTSIRCKDCGCRTGECAYEDAAIFNWNRRVCCEEKPNLSCSKPLTPKWVDYGDTHHLVLSLSQSVKWEFVISTKTLWCMSYIKDINGVIISGEDVGTFKTLEEAKAKVNEYIKWLGECFAYFSENINTKETKYE